MAFAVLMLNADRSVQGISEPNSTDMYGLTDADVEPTYAIVEYADDSQYANAIGPSAYCCTDGVSIDPRVPC